jgi:hypothetical protein
MITTDYDGLSAYSVWVSSIKPYPAGATIGAHEVQLYLRQLSDGTRTSSLSYVAKETLRRCWRLQEVGPVIVLVPARGETLYNLEFKTKVANLALEDVAGDREGVGRIVFGQSDSKEAKALEFLCELYNASSGHRFAVIPAQIFEISQRLGIDLRDAKERLRVDGYITIASPTEAIVLTVQGWREAERLISNKQQPYKIDDAYPESLAEIREELDFWVHRQHDHAVGSKDRNQVESRITHLRHLERRVMEEGRSDSRTQTIYRAEGTNSRIILQGNDNSTNTVSSVSPEFFDVVREEIKRNVVDSKEREELTQSLEEIHHAPSQTSAYERYTTFIALAANHAALMVAIAPHLPAITHWVKALSV